jgi:hypothetical protein
VERTLLHLITLNEMYTLGRTLLGEGLAHCRDFSLYNMPLAGFEPRIPESLQALDYMATEIDNVFFLWVYHEVFFVKPYL